MSQPGAPTKADLLLAALFEADGDTMSRRALVEAVWPGRERSPHSAGSYVANWADALQREGWPIVVVERPTVARSDRRVAKTAIAVGWWLDKTDGAKPRSVPVSEECLRLFKRGCAYQDIAGRLDISTDDAALYCMPLVPDEARRLHKRGQTLAHIAARLGISPEEVRVHVYGGGNHRTRWEQKRRERERRPEIVAAQAFEPVEKRCLRCRKPFMREWRTQYRCRDCIGATAGQELETYSTGSL